MPDRPHAENIRYVREIRKNVKKMNSVQRAAFDEELGQAEQRIASGQLDRAFAHLERAHVIGQTFVWPHARSHWLMCQVELRRRRGAAAFGQVLRIVLGMLGSAVGIVPVGNTGGTNISMFQRLPIDPGLQSVIDGCSSADPEHSDP